MAYHVPVPVPRSTIWFVLYPTYSKLVALILSGTATGTNCYFVAIFPLGTLLDGEPIINLPPKSVELRKVDFTKEERDFYCRLEADSRAQFAVCCFLFLWEILS